MRIVASEYKKGVDTMRQHTILSNYWKILSVNIILLFLAVSHIYCQTIKEFTLKELVLNSSDIVIARVNSTTSHWNIDRTRIYTEVELDVLENIQGNLKKEERFKIFHLGGSIDGVTTFVLEMPSLVTGRQSILFLNKQQSATYGDHFTIYGMNQGKYDITTTGRGIQNITRHNVQNSLRLEKDGILLPLSSTTSMPIQEFLSYIRLYAR